MIFLEALDSAEEGNFLSNNYFGDEESMHYYKGNYYYEDGPILDEKLIDSLGKEDWDWYVKYPKEKVNLEKLQEMHSSNRISRIYSISYEDCINHDIIKDIIFNESTTSRNQRYITIIFENGTETKFYYHEDNPAPNKDDMIGKTLRDVRRYFRNIIMEKIRQDL